MAGNGADRAWHPRTRGTPARAKRAAAERGRRRQADLLLARHGRRTHHALAVRLAPGRSDVLASGKDRREKRRLAGSDFLGGSNFVPLASLEDGVVDAAHPHVLDIAISGCLDEGLNLKWIGQ